MNIDRMSKEDIDKYWLDKDGTTFQKNGRGRTGATFARCSAIVNAFINAPGNHDLMASCRAGMLSKATIAVCEGETLTRELWSSLSGYGPEYPSSAASHAA